MLLLAAVLACVDCHKDLVERYARTPMANTSGRVRAADESPGKVGRQFTIPPGAPTPLARRSGRSYAVHRLAPHGPQFRLRVRASPVPGAGWLLRQPPVLGFPTRIRARLKAGLDAPHYARLF